eukprot:1142444-Pelagomonas_calceolata.AAC.1
MQTCASCHRAQITFSALRGDCAHEIKIFSLCGSAWMSDPPPHLTGPCPASLSSSPPCSSLLNVSGSAGALSAGVSLYTSHGGSSSKEESSEEDSSSNGEGSNDEGEVLKGGWEGHGRDE